MSVRVKVQKFGSKLSSMVIPNLGAFIAWGLLTAVGIAIDNDMLRSFITPDAQLPAPAPDRICGRQDGL